MDNNQYNNPKSLPGKTAGVEALIGLTFAGIVGLTMYAIAKTVNGGEEPLTTIKNNLRDLLQVV